MIGGGGGWQGEVIIEGVDIRLGVRVFVKSYTDTMSFGY